ncbi:DNA-binding response regulator [Aureibaculum marinum]|uniref:DNA-binding response regulator n=1 Tax=Aureibaculum marinum TaxID=2487930 RepID=A0A3N4NQ31_9FLAO|nr:LytTR family DNA-binding domain-containing protein [Aureibaculum marinum]RPD96628.1 DNA-binding response regulator [Aureibaculum marinum]
MIKAILIDDEKSAIQSLSWEIENFCEDVKIIESFTDPLDAISAINYLKPDCVFLDIEMPEMDGFQLLNSLKYRDFDLIITTAFDNYAIKAFRESAIDYLLKPIDSDDLVQAVEKIKKNKNQNGLGTELKKVLTDLVPQQGYNKIGLPLVGKTKYVAPNDIYYCKSDGNYCEIFFVDGSVEMLTKKIKEIEEIISNKYFFRVHNSYLVNINYIKEFVKTEGQYLVLENGTSIPVSRSKKNDLLKLLDN